MKKEFFVILLALLILPLAGVAAQDAQDAQSQDAYSLLSFDIGAVPTIKVDDGSYEILNYFGLNIRVADPLTITAGAYTRAGTSVFNLIKVKYDIVPQVRAVLGYGLGGPNPVADLGFEVLPFKRKISGLSTEFKLLVEYAFPTATIDQGYLLAGLLIGVGY